MDKTIDAVADTKDTTTKVGEQEMEKHPLDNPTTRHLLDQFPTLRFIDNITYLECPDTMSTDNHEDDEDNRMENELGMWTYT